MNHWTVLRLSGSVWIFFFCCFFFSFLFFVFVWTLSKKFDVYSGFPLPFSLTDGHTNNCTHIQRKGGGGQRETKRNRRTLQCIRDRQTDRETWSLVHFLLYIFHEINCPFLLDIFHEITCPFQGDFGAAAVFWRLRNFRTALSILGEARSVQSSTISRTYLDFLGRNLTGKWLWLCPRLWGLSGKV